MRSQLKFQARVIPMQQPDASGALDTIALFNADGTPFSASSEGGGAPAESLDVHGPDGRQNLSPLNCRDTEHANFVYALWSASVTAGDSLARMEIWVSSQPAIPNDWDAWQPTTNNYGSPWDEAAMTSASDLTMTLKVVGVVPAGGSYGIRTVRDVGQLGQGVSSIRVFEVPLPVGMAENFIPVSSG